MLALLQATAEDLQLIEALDEEDKCWSGAGLLEVWTQLLITCFASCQAAIMVQVG